MSIKGGFLTIAVTVIGMLVGILSLMALQVQNQLTLASAEARRHASYKLAAELRQSSDDLTRMARLYVTTGDPTYEAYFRRVLAIRDGTAPRPKDYTGFYWDFAIATGESARSDGEPIALQVMMERMHFTEDEFNKLRESQERSDALVALEDQAINAVKGVYADSQGNYTIRGEPDLALARELLHGAAYHGAKADIMAPIEEFARMVEARTVSELDEHRRRAALLARSALVLVCLAIGLLLTGFVQLRRRVTRPVGELAAAADRSEKGDYGGLVSVRGDDEIGQLARAFNRMSSAIASDIDAREQTAAALAQAREAAEAANHAKSAFLANMSHELRTPMNAILGYSEMLMEDANDEGDEEAVADLQKIHKAGKHLLALINDVLDLAKVEAGKMDVHLESFSIRQVLEEVASTVDTQVKKNGNRLHLELDPSLGEMRADVTKVRQTLLNLLSNAAKFTHGGDIRIAARPVREEEVDWIEMSVSDSGIGIAAEKLEHVFEEFSQAEDTTSRNYGGTGLGLSISRRFCQMMGGEIRVESRLGEGSTFTIRLPQEVASEEAEALDTPRAVVSANDAERTVLVIDDDPTALDLIGRTLQGAGVRVVTASDGREALRIARSLVPVAITLDVLMPDMDGWEVLQELKADPVTRDIPVIMVTMTDDRSLGYSLGATEFLTKPVDRAVLVQLLDRYAPADVARHALVVDDQEENREVLRGALEREGWRVSEAENGRVALERVAEEAPSLILLDLMMPVMNGFDFVAEMRKAEDGRAIPIVVVTAKDITEEDRRRLNGGVVALIERDGMDREALLAELREQLTRDD